ncbi:membrane-spanning 4-domains subfamily A member 14-like isoform X1 [Monodelphis domestica]|uniref:membrane-spanning 4-domains subfamily A member 14-like isoform X1 n=1 Tax=Monodelphis domestica TaxID=13616 RepID=UPI00028BDB6A|nr:membrane-spanning 4-domains subfamily A member 14-like isoform X1 [Monodelphis domestica]
MPPKTRVVESQELPRDARPGEQIVITAFPYKPPKTLLNFLKGEPKMMGVFQILLGLIITAMGYILWQSIIRLQLQKNHPIIFITGYPFWAGASYVITGYFTILNEVKYPRWMHLSLYLGVVNTLVAASGIAIILYSFYEDNYFHCQAPFKTGICAIGRTLFLGVLSLILFFTIAELCITVTVLAFKTNVIWRDAKEVVFFLPSEGKEYGSSEEDKQFKLQIQANPAGQNEKELSVSLIGDCTF